MQYSLFLILHETLKKQIIKFNCFLAYIILNWIKQIVVKIKSIEEQQKI